MDIYRLSPLFLLPRGLPSQNGSNVESGCYLLLSWTNYQTNTRVPGDLRHQDADWASLLREYSRLLYRGFCYMYRRAIRGISSLTIEIFQYFPRSRDWPFWMKSVDLRAIGNNKCTLLIILDPQISRREAVYYYGQCCIPLCGTDQIAKVMDSSNIKWGYKWSR